MMRVLPSFIHERGFFLVILTAVLLKDDFFSSTYDTVGLISLTPQCRPAFNSYFSSSIDL